ncbi:uncharacterized protein A4U43_C10F8760 [Asparagus officinalis]|uniref:Uncharacterized protein n=1 Tax=Asparagus officinalis TaxID=4686 RepID=A0A5P1E3A1_ASPOF|nr:uncharacterized protein A4U43_C10F8760 [Asparagus officinalis]
MESIEKPRGNTALKKRGGVVAKRAERWWGVGCVVGGRVADLSEGDGEVDIEGGEAFEGRCGGGSLACCDDERVDLRDGGGVTEGGVARVVGEEEEVKRLVGREMICEVTSELFLGK